MTIKTLLVEDDPMLANLALMRLGRDDMFDVFHASDGMKAMDYLEANQPDLILLDINIPIVDGWQVLEFAKATYGEHAFKVIVTSARKDMVSRAKGEIEMVDRYLVKPFTGSDLLTAINEVFNPESAGPAEDATPPDEE